MEPLSPNTDSSTHRHPKDEKRPSRSTTTNASASARPGPETGAGDDSNRSLHAHFASSPVVVQPSSSGSIEDPSASLLDVAESSLPAPSAAAEPRGADMRPMPSRASFARAAPGRDEEGGAGRSVLAQQRNVSPASLKLQRTTSPLSFAPSVSVGGSHSPYYGAGSSLHPSLARVVSAGQDPNAIYGRPSDPAKT